MKGEMKGEIWAKRILLVRAPVKSAFDFPSFFGIDPAGTKKIAERLERNGIGVRILDLENLESEGAKFSELFSKALVDSVPQIVGIYGYSKNFLAVCELSKIAKKMGKQVVIGGPQASIDPVGSLEESGADAAIVGPAEETLARMCREKDWRKVGKNCVLRGEKSARINYSALPHEMDGNWLKGEPPVSIKTSLGRKDGALVSSIGCPYSCVFCSIPKSSGKVWKAYSPGAVVRALSKSSRAGIRRFLFCDDTFGLDRRWLTEFCNQLISSGLSKRISWYCQTRADLLDGKSLELMKRAGCSIITYGVESGSQKILAALKKGLSVERIKRAFYETKRAGIGTGAYIIIGSPGETKKDIELTRKLILEIDPETLQIFNFTPFQGAEISERVAPQRESIQPVVMKKSYGEVAPRELVKFRKKILVDFYLRPKKIVEIVSKSGGVRGLFIRAKYALTQILAN